MCKERPAAVRRLVKGGNNILLNNVFKPNIYGGRNCVIFNLNGPSKWAGKRFMIAIHHSRDAESEIALLEPPSIYCLDIELCLE